MQMTNDEIVASYKQSKHPTEQVRILAELNACPVEKIIGILRDVGIDGRKLRAASQTTKQQKTAQPKISTCTVDEITGKSPANFTSVRGRVKYLLAQRKIIDDELAEIAQVLRELSEEIGTDA